MSHSFLRLGRPVAVPKVAKVARLPSSFLSFSTFLTPKFAMAQSSTASAVPGQRTSTWKGAGAAEFDLRSMSSLMHVLCEDQCKV